MWHRLRFAPAVVGLAVLAVVSAQDRVRPRPLPTASQNAQSGPKVGAKIPAISAVDQTGKPRDFSNLTGSNGLVLIFARSADWCPYCKTHLADMNTQFENWQKKGYNIASVTYDSPAVLKDFSYRLGIRYPMLSDADSKTIKAFGILNTNIDPQSGQYGIPFPGTYIVNAKGVVTAKYFEDDYRERYSAASIVTHEVGIDGIDKNITDNNQVRITTSTSDVSAGPGHRITLIVDVEPKEKMHLYAPGVKNYIPIDWQLDESKAYSAISVTYPPSKMVDLPAIKETVPVYNKTFRLTRDLVIGQESEISSTIGSARELVINGNFKLQACDDRQCYLPKTIPLTWKISVGKLDTKRPPEAIQKKL